jgi:hypothetical protein
LTRRFPRGDPDAEKIEGKVKNVRARVNGDSFFEQAAKGLVSQKFELFSE